MRDEFMGVDMSEITSSPESIGLDPELGIFTKFDDIWRSAEESGDMDIHQDLEQGVFHERLFLHLGNDALRCIMLLRHYEVDDNSEPVDANYSIFILDPALAKYLYPHSSEGIVFRLEQDEEHVSIHDFRDTGSGLETLSGELPHDQASLRKLDALLQDADFDRREVSFTSAA